jgi:co-chaperonin GroES (HSP10)
MSAAEVSMDQVERSIRAYDDNVIVRILPDQNKTEGGLFIPDQATYDPTAACQAVVIASGPGYRRPRKVGANGVAAIGPFIPNQTRPGDIVLITRDAGQNFDMDLTCPRHNKAASWADDRGEFRILREEEILGILEGAAEHVASPLMPSAE